MTTEALAQMANSRNPEKREKTQGELRGILEGRLNLLKSFLFEGLAKYDLAIKDETFDDGDGEKRKVAMQNELENLFERARKIREKLDSKEPLPQDAQEISTRYTHPDGRIETITIDIETKLQDFVTFYAKTKIDLPPDFEDIIRDIWNRYQDRIQEAIEQKGFDEILIIPGNIPLPELAEKMKMEKGYFEGQDFKDGGSFAGAVSINADKPRIILVHKAQNLYDRPELASTLNTMGVDVKIGNALRLEDYLIFQRKYFEETNKHLDEVGATWLSTESGDCLVYSDWNHTNRVLHVVAEGRETRVGLLGVRSSRSFL